MDPRDIVVDVRIIGVDPRDIVVDCPCDTVVLYNQQCSAARFANDNNVNTNSTKDATYLSCSPSTASHPLLHPRRRTVACTASSASAGELGTTLGRDVDRINPSGVVGSGDGAKLGLKGSGEGCVRGLGATVPRGGAWWVV